MWVGKVIRKYIDENILSCWCRDVEPMTDVKLLVMYVCVDECVKGKRRLG